MATPDLGPVWLITGAQASGKSTVADLLANQFDRGVHIRGGQFYRWAVRGWVHAGDPGYTPAINDDHEILRRTGEALVG